MNPTQKHPPCASSQETLAALREAVTEALEKKRLLGQYAVVWKDGHPVFIGEEKPI